MKTISIGGDSLKCLNNKGNANKASSQFLAVKLDGGGLSRVGFRETRKGHSSSKVKKGSDMGEGC